MRLRQLIGGLAAIGLVVAATATSAAAETKPTAKSVILSFERAHLPVTGVVIYNATTDPNSLLGRPGSYTSKGAWVDRRVPKAKVDGDSKGDVDYGGSVEVFGSASEAKTRAAYLEKVEAAVGILGTEYDFLAGDVLIRVSQYLTPSQAGGYARADHAKLYTAN